MRPADSALVGQLQDPLGPGVDRPVHGMPEAGHLAAVRVELAREASRDGGRLGARLHLGLRLLEQTGTRLRGAEDYGSGAQDSSRDCALQRARICRERHPGGDVRRHHPVLGDRDQQDVEEVPLLLGRLLAREEQV